MNWINSKIFNNLLTFSNYVILSLIWIVCCLPLFTIFPSTISMFAVIKRWKNGESDRIIALFFEEFKKKIGQKFLINIILVSYLAVIELDVNRLIAVENNPVKIVIMFAMLIMLAISVHIFNLFIHFDNIKTFVLFKNAFLIAILQIHWTLVGMFILLISILLVYIFPLLVFCIGSFVAYLLILISDHALKKINYSF